MKIGILLLSFILLLAQPISAKIAPIIWSESIHTTKKLPTEIINLDNYLIIKSDRSISLDLTEHSPIKTIVLRPDNTNSSYFDKKTFLFSIELSEKAKKIVNIPFGQHSFN